MSSIILDEAELLVHSRNEGKWSSLESINTQRITKLSQSDSHFSNFTRIDSNVTFKELELLTTSIDNASQKSQWTYLGSRIRFPRLIQTRSAIRDELEMLKINMSGNEKAIGYKDSQLTVSYQPRKRRRRARKLLAKCKKLNCCSIRSRKLQDLVSEIEASECAKRDTVPWKFLKRGSLITNDLENNRSLFSDLHDWLSLDYQFQTTQPLKITCPNCTFYITTNIKKVSTIKTRLFGIAFAIIRLCVSSHAMYSFKGTVHLCPLCKIYLGFFPDISLHNVRGSSVLPVEDKCPIKS